MPEDTPLRGEIVLQVDWLHNQIESICQRFSSISEEITFSVKQHCESELPRLMTEVRQIDAEISQAKSNEKIKEQIFRQNKSVASAEQELRSLPASVDLYSDFDSYEKINAVDSFKLQLEDVCAEEIRTVKGAQAALATIPSYNFPKKNAARRNLENVTMIFRNAVEAYYSQEKRRIETALTARQQKLYELYAELRDSEAAGAAEVQRLTDILQQKQEALGTLQSLEEALGRNGTAYVDYNAYLHIRADDPIKQIIDREIDAGIQEKIESLRKRIQQETADVIRDGFQQLHTQEAALNREKADLEIKSDALQDDL